MKDPSLHLISGGKGGVGKTLCSLSYVLFSLHENRPSLFVDLNYQNNDLSGVLLPLIDPRSIRTLADSGFKIAPIPREPHQSDNHYLVFPDRKGDVFGSLPWEGGLGVLRDLDNILSHVLNGRGVRPNFNPIRCIVDTGLHLTNFSPNVSKRYLARFSDRPDIREVIEAQSLHGGSFDGIRSFNLYIWFVWTLASLGTDRLDEVSAIERTLTELEAVTTKNGQKWFTANEQLIHVLNLHAFSKDYAWYERLWKSRSAVEGLESLLNSDAVGSPLDFVSFYRTAATPLREMGSSLRETYLEHIARAIGSVTTTDGKRRWHRPGNVFVIPYFRKELAAYTDRLNLGEELSKDHSEDAMREYLAEVYQSIATCLRAM